MRAKRFLNWGPQRRDVAVLAAAVLLGLFLLQQDNRAWMAGVKRILPGVFLHLERPAHHLLEAGTLRAENAQLHEALGTAALEAQQGREALLENRRLREMLGLQQRAAYGLHPAEMIGRAPAGQPGRTHLSFVQSEAIKENLTLVTPQGLAGRLVSILHGGGTAQLVDSPDFRCGVLNQRTRVHGIIRWLHDNICVLEGIPARADMKPGDRIVTTGQSLIYPGGLLVGHVLSIETPEKGLFKEVRVRTAVDFSALERVLIVLPLQQAQGREH